MNTKLLTKKHNSMTRTYTIARFICGCVYLNPLDTAVFCPAHRHSPPHHGHITGRETIEVPADTPYSMRHLTPHRTMNQCPTVLTNSAHNSIHTLTAVSDSDHNDWETPSAGKVGLCATCLIDDHEHRETEAAMCECGDETCSYRWCGSLKGLHAFWRLHAQGLSENLTGTAEADIFNNGSYEHQSPKTTEILNKELQDLGAAVQRIAKEIQTTRETPFAHNRDTTSRVRHMNPWLDDVCRQLVGAVPGSKQAQDAEKALTTKALRLHVIGAMQPS